MRIFKYDTKELYTGEVNEERGVIEHGSIKAIAHYIIESPAEYREEVVNEYPNGGKDIAYVLEKEEIGKWQMFDFENNKIELSVYIPDDYPHELPFECEEQVLFYRELSDEELEQIKSEELEMKKSEARQAKIQAALDSLPETLADSDDAICELYETTIAQQAAMDEQDAAICELYELMIGGVE